MQSVLPMAPDASDLSLVQRVQRGERSAYDLLVLKYQHKVVKLVMRYLRDPADAEDVAQEAFIKAYRALPQFRGDSAFYTWLYRIAINTAKNALAARDRNPVSYDFDMQSGDESTDMVSRLKDPETPEGLALTEEIRNTVNAAIEALPEDLRTAIVLRELEGLSFDGLPGRHGALAHISCPRGHRSKPARGFRWRSGSGGGACLMQDEVESQLSAMFDGELAAAQCELLSRRLDRDETLRARWSRYALIGAAMRSEPVATARSGFAQRVSAAIESGSPRQPTASRRRLRRANLLWSGALAATLVAGVAGLGVSMLRDAALSGGTPAPLMTAVPAAPRPTIASTYRPDGNAGAIEATLGNPVKVATHGSDSYVTPKGTPGVSTLLRTQLADYIVAHSAYSPPLLQRSVLSELATSEGNLGIATSFAGAAGASTAADATRSSSDVSH